MLSNKDAPTCTSRTNTPSLLNPAVGVLGSCPCDSPDVLITLLKVRIPEFPSIQALAPHKNPMLGPGQGEGDRADTHGVGPCLITNVDVLLMMNFLL